MHKGTGSISATQLAFGKHLLLPLPALEIGANRRRACYKLLHSLGHRGTMMTELCCSSFCCSKQTLNSRQTRILLNADPDRSDVPLACVHAQMVTLAHSSLIYPAHHSDVQTHYKLIHVITRIGYLS